MPPATPVLDTDLHIIYHCLYTREHHTRACIPENIIPELVYQRTSYQSMYTRQRTSYQSLYTRQRTSYQSLYTREHHTRACIPENIIPELVYQRTSFQSLYTREHHTRACIPDIEHHTRACIPDIEHHTRACIPENIIPELVPENIIPHAGSGIMNVSNLS